MPNEPLWKEFPDRLDRPDFLPRCDRCFYARDYTSHGGYAASEGNSLIANLKKKPDLRGTPQWKYKVRAICQFAKELSSLIPSGMVVVAIPPSKTTDHPEYDSRLEDVLARLVGIRPDLRHERPIVRTRSNTAQHQSESRQSVEEIYDCIEWVGFKEDTDHVILIDDVVTMGRTYAACRKLIRENALGISTYGVFWARTVWA
jgi:predicted amidophosphoribosyltransferase